MDRRVFLGTLAGGLLLSAVEAQQPKKGYRIGVIDPGTPFYERRGSWLFFFQELREAGFLVGQDTMFELRPLGRPDQLQASVDELIALRVDMIMAGGTPAALAAKRGTSTIPVLFYNVADPVGSGLVTTLSRPGGNATGITHVSKELMGKRVELLKHLLPSVSRVAVFAGPSASLTMTDTEGAVRAGGLAATTVLAADPSEFEGAFTRMAKERVGAVIVLPESFFYPSRERLAELAMMNRLPTMYELRGYVDAGGLMSYGASADDMLRRLGTYVVKILQGAKPMDLPVQQATQFELVINLKTAKALGLTIPPALLQRADQVIE
jgi:putative ABC transport system substrate-binding protein